jgi:hypothetical protein
MQKPRRFQTALLDVDEGSSHHFTIPFAPKIGSSFMLFRIRVCWVVLLALLVCNGSRAADHSTLKNVILITLDGLRPEEFFTGADTKLMTKENGVSKPDELKSKYWRETEKERRELLLPFLWKQCQSEIGWVAGDITLESRVTVSNGLYFSYPGYSELLCGFADPRINSNNKIPNPNLTVLEWLHRLPEFKDKVSAYGSWDVFPYVINEKRSGIPVNAGWQPLSTGDPARIAALNDVADYLFHEWDGVRYDVITVSGAIEEIKTRQPRVMFVGLGETDDWAHAGRYDRYLLSAQQNDSLIQKLWQTTQELPAYRNNTLFIVTTDHGRGDGREGWKNHGVHLPGSNHIWVAAFGNEIAKTGIDRGGQFVQAQVASTVAGYLGYDFTKHANAIHPPLPIVPPSTKSE